MRQLDTFRYAEDIALPDGVEGIFSGEESPACDDAERFFSHAVESGKTRSLTNVPAYLLCKRGDEVGIISVVVKNLLFKQIRQPSGLIRDSGILKGCIAVWNYGMNTGSKPPDGKFVVARPAKIRNSTCLTDYLPDLFGFDEPRREYPGMKIDGELWRHSMRKLAERFDTFPRF